MWRKYFGIGLLGIVSVGAVGGTRTGRQILGSSCDFARAYQNVQNSGVRTNLMERVALSAMIASATRPACHEGRHNLPTSSSPRPSEPVPSWRERAPANL